MTEEDAASAAFSSSENWLLTLTDGTYADLFPSCCRFDPNFLAKRQAGLQKYLGRRTHNGSVHCLLLTTA